jgi:lysophospholipase L1-like esterase/dienelactone hydrolase
MRSQSLFLLCFILEVSGTFGQSKSEMPKVVLAGDSIRLGYAPLVAKMLVGKAIVVSAEETGGDSGNVLAHLDAWIVREKPDIVHWNAGLHDLKISKQTRTHQVELPQYAANLRQIVERIRKETSATLIFASTTPILDERHARRKADFDRLESDVRRYNQAALQVMKGAGITMNDLHWVVEKAGSATLMTEDGTHYSPEGYERLADAVGDCILRAITVRRYRPLPQAAAGAEAAEAYRKEEAERDARVPAAYKGLKLGRFEIPDDEKAWNARRPLVKKAVIESLGHLPARPSPVRARVIAREVRQGYTLERVSIENGFDGEISSLLLLPESQTRPRPAILWLHSSTPDKTQIIIPNTNGGSEPLGEAFVRAGYVVLSPDAFWHGDRVGTGPAGIMETGGDEQESLFKLNLWLGRTLWGMFVRDDQIALDYLCARPEVDKTKIGTTGMSMGSTRAWWLAAVDDRISAVVGVACLTRYENLIAHGQLRQHGVYYFADGLLKDFDAEGVLALIAPRPFLALTGELDAGSPVDGIRILEDRVGGVYAALKTREQFRSVLYPETGHAFTSEMRREMFNWFTRWLQ